MTLLRKNGRQCRDGGAHRLRPAGADVGVVGLAGTLWAFRRLRRRGHRFADAIDADNAGCGVRSAQALLADIRRFEQE